MNKDIISTQGEFLKETSSWDWLKNFTDARIALGRTGCSLLTKDYLDFSLAHARAKDSITTPFDRERIKAELQKMGLSCLYADSAAHDRTTFIARPDLGRRLSDRSREELVKMNYPGADVLIVIGDGLSSKAVHKQAVPLIRRLLPYLKELNLSLAPIVLASQSRVALGDDIAEVMHCRLVAMLIGERPGLSSPDSLGVYMTYDPYRGRLESERNCISNIRPEGLSYDRAAFKLAWLIESAFNRRLSGTQLKDLSDDPSQYHRIKPYTHPSVCLEA